MEGRVIGQYRVTDVLGKGGMGVVYAAQHTLLGRPAALKLLLPELSSKQEIVQRFFNEARAATAIRHRGIIEIYDFGWTDDGAAFLVMELLEGETLRARRKRGPMTWSTALAFVRQVAGALGAAHAKGIIHRDLKPDNIFLIPDSEVMGGERIKLLDFGIAKLAGAVQSGHRTRTGTVLGTPAYMAPEQCRGVAVDARADIYALGCILFWLCAGRPPFIAKLDGDVIAAHINQPPPPMASLVSGVPRDLEALVQRMLAKQPADRVQSAEELVRLIDAVRAALGQLAGSGPQPILASASPLGARGAERGGATGLAPTEPVSGSAPTTEPADGDVPATVRVDAGVAPTEPASTGTAPTRAERAGSQQSRQSRREAARPAIANTQVQTMARAPAATLRYPQLDTTISNADDVRPRGPARTPARRFAIIGGAAGGLAIGIALWASARSDEGGASARAEAATAAPAPVGSPPAQAPASPPTEVTPPGTAPSVSPLPAQPPQPAAPAETAPSPAKKSGEPAPDTSAPPAPPAAGSAAAGAQPAAPGAPRSHGDDAAHAPTTRSHPATVRLTIDSDPRGATIFLGEEALGQTPWVGPVPWSDETVRFLLRLGGYQNQVLLIRPNMSNAYKAPLEQTPPSQPQPATAP
jgi:hypothetical protein